MISDEELDETISDEELKEFLGWKFDPNSHESVFQEIAQELLAYREAERKAKSSDSKAEFTPYPGCIQHFEDKDAYYTIIPALPGYSLLITQEEPDQEAWSRDTLDILAWAIKKTLYKDKTDIHFDGFEPGLAVIPITIYGMMAGVIVSPAGSARDADGVVYVSESDYWRERDDFEERLK